MIYDLVADDFHLRIRSERPASYPPRHRISIDEAPWMLDCASYAPPYHVDPAVLESDRTKVDGGWADPEEFTQRRDLQRLADGKYRDDDGKPLNPHGRTGLAGRGLLGLWGANLSVQMLVARANPDSGRAEVLAGGREGSSLLEIPKGFVLPNEASEEAVHRVLVLETGWDPGDVAITQVTEGYTYDLRQTDNAWVEMRAFMILAEDAPTLMSAGGDFDEIKWRSLDAEMVNRFPSDQARLIRECIPHLISQGLFAEVAGKKLLASTG